MRVVLVLPSRSDPAHRRVRIELGKALAARGHALRTFPPAGRLRAGAGRRVLEGLLRRGRADICHVQFFSRGLDYLKDLVLPSGTRLVLTHQGADAAFMDHPRVFRALARRADFITAVSAHGLGELARRFPEIAGKSGVVFNGVDVPSRSGKVKPSPGRPMILCVSRLAAYKGIDILGMAFGGLLGQGHDVELAACGPDQTGGRLKGFLNRLGLGGRVRLLGVVPAPRVRSLLSRCLFFVLPSRRENMPMALLEAMAAGKAVIAARVGGIPEVISDGINGLLFDAGDVEGLERAMAAVLGNPALRARLGRAAGARARGFGWKRAAAGYGRIYRSVVAGQAARIESIREVFPGDAR